MMSVPFRAGKKKPEKHTSDVRQVCKPPDHPDRAAGDELLVRILGGRGFNSLLRLSPRELYGYSLYDAHARIQDK